MKNIDKIKRRKADTQRREIRKMVNFSPLEWQKIKNKLELEDLSFPEFARASILQTKSKKVPKSKKEMLFEINKIGNNLNQITRRVNENRTIDLQTMKGIFEIRKQLSNLRNVS